MNKTLIKLIELGESETLEFKRIWKPEYLKTLGAFANRSGGNLLVGITDDAKILGIENANKILETLPNQISDNLGLTAGVQIIKYKNVDIVQIEIHKSLAPISYHGKFYLRSGSVTREMRAQELNYFLLKQYGKTWDDIPIENFTLQDIDEKTIQKFKNLASDRIPGIQKENNLELILRKLNLYDGDSLKRAAVLLFAKNPQKYFIQSHTKIGKFLSEVDMISNDYIEGNLIDQVDVILQVLRTKYLNSTISFEGIHRKEILEYPYEALKEIIINALIHRDYSNTSNLQIKVYKHKVSFTNGALLPNDITIDKLKQAHASIPKNPLIASVFYKAGLIENWGRGTINILNYCKIQNIPEPEFKFDMNIFWVVLYKDTKNVPLNAPLNVPLNVPLNERQKELLKMIQKMPAITQQFLSEQLKVNIKTVKRDLIYLQEKNIITRMGSKKTGYWKA